MAATDLWFEFHQSMPRHPKTLKLAQAIKKSRRETVGLLADFLTWALNCAEEDGSLKEISDEGVALSLDWPVNKAKSLCKALIETGWLDGTSGNYRIHNWPVYTKGLYERRKERERKRAERGKKNNGDSPENVRGQSPDKSGTIPEKSPDSPNITTRAYITEPNRTEPNQDKGSCLVPPTPRGEDRTDGTDFDPDSVLEDIKAQVEYDVLVERFSQNEVDELLVIMQDAICSQSPTGTISGERIPRRLIRQRMMSLECEHLLYVLEGRGKSHGEIKNIKAYLRAMLYNAPASCANAEAALFERTAGGTG